MDWNDMGKYEAAVEALNRLYPKYTDWFTTAGRHSPRDLYFKNGNHIHVVDGTEPDYTTIINGGRACGKSLTAMMETLAVNIGEKNSEARGKHQACDTHRQLPRSLRRSRMIYTLDYGGNYTANGTTRYYICAPQTGVVSRADMSRFYSLCGKTLYTKDGDIKPVSIPASEPTVSFDDLYGGQDDTV